MSSVAPVCAVPDCGGLVKARGYCGGHHMRLLRGWTEDRINEPPLVRRAPRNATPRLCERPDCGRPHQARGLCGGHYARLKSGSSLEAPIRHQRQVHGRYYGCYYPGCPEKHAGSGLCNRHLKLKTRYHLSSSQVIIHAYSSCEICADPSGLHVDHDRSCCPGFGSCGSCVRGFLCGNCNVALGMIRDNTKTLSSAIDYLSRQR